MKNKNIIFLSSGNKQLEKVVTRALMATESNIEIGHNVAEVSQILNQKKIDLLLLDYDDKNAMVTEAAQEIWTRSPDLPTVFLSEKKEKEHLIELFSHKKLKNLIARNDQILEEELVITVEKLLRNDIFGMNKYFSWGVSFIEEPIIDSHEKNKQVARVADYVRKLKCDERFVQLAEVISDEMIMNALFDAPVDANGKSLYAHLPRHERVQLEPGRAYLQYGTDGKFFGISCRDSYGALKSETVVSYLKKCFTQDEHQVDTKKGGAGVGFFMIFQSISQLIINIQPNVMTETLGLIDIRPMFKETKKRTKSLNIFLQS